MYFRFLNLFRKSVTAVKPQFRRIRNSFFIGASGPPQGRPLLRPRRPLQRSLFQAVGSRLAAANSAAPQSPLSTPSSALPPSIRIPSSAASGGAPWRRSIQSGCWFGCATSDRPFASVFLLVVEQGCRLNIAIGNRPDPVSRISIGKCVFQFLTRLHFVAVVGSP
ncbi:MAG: hypothetical protein ACI9R3_002816 [Verrucomicrobiales bacterium]|jgi:hypothetical protein